MNKPKVSIVVPVCNVEKYLAECLDSIINQTLKEIEIICVNDGSTDNSLSILREYEARDSRVRVIDKPNAGYGHTMNVGMDAAQGEYIGIVESDDFVALNMFENLYKEAVENDVDFVKSNFYKFRIDNDNIKKTFVDNNIITDQVIFPSEHPEIILKIAATWTAIYRREFLNRYHIRHNETPGASYQDIGFLFLTFMYASRVYYIKDAYYMYRFDNPNSSIHNKGKVYCCCDEYDHILNVLSNDKLIVIDKKAFMPVYWARRFINYMSTYSRIDNKFKREYIIHFAEVFSKAKKNNEILNKYFSKNDLGTFNSILSDPVKFDRQWKARRKKERYAKEHNGKKLSCITRGIWCLQDHGLIYTIKLSFLKLKTKIKPRHFSYLDAPGAHLRIIGRKILRLFCLENLNKHMKMYKNMKDRHEGERCFIVCTGPSLKIEDLEKLKGEYTIGVNSIFRAYAETDWRPTYYATVDSYIFDRYNSVYDMDFEKFCERDIFLNHYIPVRETERIHKVLISYANHTKRRKNKRNFIAKEDISICIYDCYTVTNMAINIAVYMGFKEIYIIGADCNFESDKMHFIPNPFDSHGEKRGRLSKEVDLSISGYHTLKEFAERRGIHIYNATRGGHLEVFERVSFDMLFDKGEVYDPYDIVMKAIESNARGKEIVLWGNSPAFETRIKQKYGYLPQQAVMSESVANGRDIKCLINYAGQQEKYYIVNPSAYPTTNLLNQVGKIGYRNIDNIWFGKHFPFEVTQKNYADQYGNRLINCPPKCKVIFKGEHSSVIFGEGCRCLDSYTIAVEDNSHVLISNDCTLIGEILCKNNVSLYIGKNCKLGNHLFILSDNSIVKIEDEVTVPVKACLSVTPFEIRCHAGYKVYIGRDCMFSSAIAIIAGSGHAIFDVETGKNVYAAEKMSENQKRVYIGSHVWLGYGVTVLNGAYIESGCMVGARSLIKMKCPNNCMVAGSPCKIIKRNIAWSRNPYEEKINSLPLEFRIATQSSPKIKYLKKAGNT